MAATPGGSRWPGAVTARNGPRHRPDLAAQRAALRRRGRPRRAADRDPRQAAPRHRHPPFYTDHGLRIGVGEHVFVNQGCTFYDQGGTALGDGVLVGPRTSLISSDHPLAASERADFITRAPVTVEAGAMLGSAVTVLPGVTIGRGAVVGAGTVVTKDVPPHTLVTGPAASVRKRWEG